MCLELVALPPNAQKYLEQQIQGIDMIIILILIIDSDTSEDLKSRMNIIEILDVSGFGSNILLPSFGWCHILFVIL